MSNGIRINKFMNNSKDDEIWEPINDKVDIDTFTNLISDVRNSFEGGTKTEKGTSLESLMTFVFKRFAYAEVRHDVLISDNQIDHIVEFMDGLTPTFINDHLGLRLIGESKNHAATISGREVSNLSDLLEFRKSVCGIFSSVKGFSKKGRSFWTYAEGTRRKIFLRKQQSIVGFTLDELESLTTENFYTMLKKKYECLTDEIEDNLSYDADNVPYPDKLHKSLKQLYELGIIDEESYPIYTKNIVEKYGVCEIDI